MNDKKQNEQDEREETIRDLDVPEGEAGDVNGSEGGHDQGHGQHEVGRH